jgi:metal-responsive CopG/Arc/MetJ family transcriptional regulator
MTTNQDDHTRAGGWRDTKVSVMLHHTVVDAIDERARRLGLSRSYLIGTIVEEWLARSTQ